MKEKKEEKRKPKKLLCGLYYKGGKVGFEDVYYPGMFDGLSYEEARKLQEDPDYCHAIGDREHPDLLVTDDADCLSDRLASEWDLFSLASEYIKRKILLLSDFGCDIAEVRIEGKQFGMKDGSYINISVYDKELVYDERTQKYLDKIKKELKK